MLSVCPPTDLGRKILPWNLLRNLRKWSPVGNSHNRVRGKTWGNDMEIGVRGRREYVEGQHGREEVFNSLSSWSFQYICPLVRVIELCGKIRCEICVSEVWTVILLHEIHIIWNVDVKQVLRDEVQTLRKYPIFSPLKVISSCKPIRH